MTERVRRVTVNGEGLIIRYGVPGEVADDPAVLGGEVFALDIADFVRYGGVMILTDADPCHVAGEAP